MPRLSPHRPVRGLRRGEPRLLISPLGALALAPPVDQCGQFALHVRVEVGQIVLPKWSSGRVVLVGDAAWCVTLFARFGASLAVAGADLLGAALDNHPGDIAAALAVIAPVGKLLRCRLQLKG